VPRGKVDSWQKFVERLGGGRDEAPYSCYLSGIEYRSPAAALRCCSEAARETQLPITTDGGRDSPEGANTHI